MRRTHGRAPWLPRTRRTRQSRVPCRPAAPATRPRAPQAPSAGRSSLGGLVLAVAAAAGWCWSSRPAKSPGDGARAAPARESARRVQPRRHHARHDARRPHRGLRRDDVRDPGTRRARAREGVLFEQADGHGPADAAGALQHLHRQVPARARRPRQRRLLPRPGAGHARRSAEGARLQDRRLHRRLRARPEVGDRPGVRHLLRRLRHVGPRARQSPATSSGRATRSWTRRCRGSTRPRTAVLRVDAPLRSAHALRAAGALSTRSTPAHPYTGEIAFMDAQVGRVVAFLDRTGLLDRTVIAVMGDHGESLGEHGEDTHGFFIYESATRVPFVIRAPFERAQARRVADPVRVVDLMPTVLDLLGVPGRQDGLGRQPRPADDRRHAGTRARRLRRGDVPAPPLRVERPAGAAGGALQGDRRAAAGTLRPRAGPGEKPRNLFEQRRALGDRMVARLREFETGVQQGRTPTARRRRRPRSAGAPGRARLRRARSWPARTTRGPTAPTRRTRSASSTCCRQRARRHRRTRRRSTRSWRCCNEVVARGPQRHRRVVQAGQRRTSGQGATRKPSISTAVRSQLKPDYDLAVINIAPGLPPAWATTRRRSPASSTTCASIPKDPYVRYQMGEIYLDRGDLAQGRADVPRGPGHRQPRWPRRRTRWASSPSSGATSPRPSG